MLKQIENLVSESTIQAILDTIIERYCEYERLVNSDRFQRVFLAEYAPHNRQFSISWAISSGFPSGTRINNELNIARLEYSRKFTRPLLENENIYILILNKTTHFNADYLKEYYALNNSAREDAKRFCYFKFSVDNRKLTKVSLCYPNEHGDIVAEELLLNKSQIELKLAS